AGLEAKHGVRITFTHLLMKAVAFSLKQHPIINSTMAGEEIRILSDINIGMAVSLPDGGLLTPVIRNVDRRPLVEVARDAITITEKVRAKKFSLDDLKGGTFTLTNAGMYGTDFVTVLIPTPQAAAMGVGRLVPKPVVRDGQIVIRTMMGLSLTYDHRILTGVTAAQFFQTVEKNVEQINTLDLGL
ncbi:MAG: 2-oxo acid dehydrogenase subunit E2, partial [Dehalococcoidales bacterium]|nr:2-oxo acid dehydrogenase subunit E2 [Dehalococcoidales bacterium]